MKYKPAKIVLLGHGENSIYNIEMEMRVTYKDSVEITTEIADIQDRHKIFGIMKSINRISCITQLHISMFL